ncbi:unnamed protein product [Spirodela intermedia]|uniref:Histone H2A C-terminal domain-containing protein n=1 Tax=Spirodela intermedia TaxID=51605 RepID=A0A7I8IP55_SPIIN|nr:unnamed protein product [Spirodela intermedia]CAA6659676.1 unnamed protein product [Spirodela intermedia]
MDRSTKRVGTDAQISLQSWSGSKEADHPLHLLLAVRNDEELARLFSGITIACGAVLPNIGEKLLPKKTATKAGSEPRSRIKSPMKDEVSSASHSVTVMSDVPTFRDSPS